MAASEVGVCAATSPARRYYPEPPESRMYGHAIVVQLSGGVSGFLELRCDDGTQVSQEVTGRGMVARSPLPAQGAECKLRMLGVPGSFGPVTSTTREIDCVVVDRIQCHAQERR